MREMTAAEGVSSTALCFICAKTKTESVLKSQLQRISASFYVRTIEKYQTQDIRLIERP